jgi:hypothetical protein
MVVSSKHEAAGAGAMMRTRSKMVNFTQPFSLSVMDGRQPAGAYMVETDEEMIGSVSFPAYHRRATWIRLPSPVPPAGVSAGLDRVINVDPTELDGALARDLAGRGEGTLEAPLPRREAQESRLPVTVREVPIPHAPRNFRGAARFTARDWLDANRSNLTWIALAFVGLPILGFLMQFDVGAH